MRKLKVFLIISILIISIFTLFTGGLNKFSWQKESNLERLVLDANLNVTVPAVKIEKMNNVVIMLYEDARDNDFYYIVEFVKSPVINMFAIEDAHRADMSEEPIFYSVISDSFYDYPYNVNMITGLIEISEGQRSFNLIWTLLTYFILIFGIIFYEKDRKKNEKLVYSIILTSLVLVSFVSNPKAIYGFENCNM